MEVSNEAGSALLNPFTYYTEINKRLYMSPKLELLLSAFMKAHSVILRKYVSETAGLKELEGQLNNELKSLDVWNLTAAGLMRQYISRANNLLTVGGIKQEEISNLFVTMNEIAELSYLQYLEIERLNNSVDELYKEGKKRPVEKSPHEQLVDKFKKGVARGTQMDAIIRGLKLTYKPEEIEAARKDFMRSVLGADDLPEAEEVELPQDAKPA